MESGTLDRDRDAEDRPAAPVAAENGEGADTGLTPSQENHLYGKMIRFSRERWPLTEKVIAAAVGVTARNLSSSDPRVVNGAVKNLLAMEAQNIRVEEVVLQLQAKAAEAKSQAQVNVQVNNAVTVGTIEYRELPPRGEPLEVEPETDGDTIVYEVPG